MANEQVASIETLHGAFGPKVFADLLRRLTNVRTVAYIIVSDGRSEKCVFFPVGGVRLASIGARRVRGLAEVVLAHPDLPPDVAQKLRALIAQRGARSFPTARREAGEPRAASPSESRTGDEPEAKDELEALLGAPEVRPIYHACCRQIIRDELIDLVAWDGAEYEFRESNPPPKLFAPEVEAVKLSLGVKDVLEEVLALIPEWTKLSAKLGQPSKSSCRRGPALTSTSKLTAHAIAVAAVMGEKGCTVDEALIALRRGGKDTIAAGAALVAMADQGQVVIDVRPPPPSAEQRKKRARTEIDEIEAALGLMIQQLMARKRLASTYQEVGDTPRAVENLRIVGDELLGQGRADEAIDSFREIVTLMPDAFDARERIAAIYERLRRMPEAVKEWLGLARQLAKLNLWNRALASLRKAVNLGPDDADNRRRLADLLAAQGQVDPAVKEFEALARLHQQAGRPDDALACWQRVLQLRPEHEVAAERVRATIRRGVAWFAPIVVLSAGALLALVVGVWVAYRYQAIMAYRAARAEAIERAMLSQWAAARTIMDTFDAAWRFDPPRIARVRAALDFMQDDEGTAMFARARGREEAGRIPDAREGYRTLERLHGASPWGERATERLRAVKRLEEDAKQKASNAAHLLAERRIPEAFDEAREVGRRFVWTAEASTVEVPLEVRTNPAGASLAVDGTSLAQPTPCIVTRPARPYLLRISKEGYRTLERRIDPLGADLVTPLVIELERTARWRVETLAPLAESPCVVSDGGLVVAAADQRVYGVTPDGQVRWTRTLPPFAQAAGPALAVGAVTVFGDSGGSALGIDPRTGATRWSRRIAPASGAAALRLVGVADGAALMVTANAVVALDGASGEERWRVALPAASTGLVGVSATRLAVVTADGAVVVIDLARHALEASLGADPRPSVAPALDAAGRCVIATEDGAVSLRQGEKTVWTSRVGLAAHAAPVIADSLVLVPSGVRLVALSLDDGSQRWERGFSGPISSPAVRGAHAWVVGQDGLVSALAVATGDVLWSLRTGGGGAGERLAAPVEARGLVYVAAPDGGVYAIPD